jgi:hypothetical protein
MGKDFEGRDYGLVMVFSRYFPGGDKVQSVTTAAARSMSFSIAKTLTNAL